MQSSEMAFKSQMHRLQGRWKLGVEWEKRLRQPLTAHHTCGVLERPQVQEETWFVMCLEGLAALTLGDCPQGYVGLK